MTMTGLTFVMTCICLVALAASQQQVCQKYREYCNPSGGFPGCCVGLTCQNSLCDGIGGGGNNRCAKSGEDCGRQSCCPGTVCVNNGGFVGSRCKEIGDIGGGVGNCARRNERCDIRSCCAGTRCQNLGNSPVCV